MGKYKKPLVEVEDLSIDEIIMQSIQQKDLFKFGDEGDGETW